MSCIQLDWQKLLGFDQVFDFVTNEPKRNDRMSGLELARIGARVGQKGSGPAARALAARIGAKVGGKEV